MVVFQSTSLLIFRQAEYSALFMVHFFGEKKPFVFNDIEIAITF